MKERRKEETAPKKMIKDEKKGKEERKEEERWGGERWFVIFWFGKRPKGLPLYTVSVVRLGVEVETMVCATTVR